MTYSDVMNCTFEPKTGSLNPRHKAKGDEEIPNQDTYAKQHEGNFLKSHPEVYKSGQLKLAKLQVKRGEFATAMGTLQNAFNIWSLRRNFGMEKYAKAFIAMGLKKKLNANKLKGINKSVSFAGDKKEEEKKIDDDAPPVL